MSGAGTLSTPGREQTQECEHSEPSGGRVWPAAGWHSGVLLQRGNKPRFYQSKKKKKKRKSALLITFDFLLILCCWWWTGASSVLKPRCLHTAVISSWLFALISFFSALGKHLVEKNPSFSLFCLARFPQTNIRDTYSSWLQHPAGLTAPRAQSLPVVTKLGLFIIPPNKRRCGDVSAPRNEAQD